MGLKKVLYPLFMGLQDLFWGKEKASLCHNLGVFLQVHLNPYICFTKRTFGIVGMDKQSAVHNTLYSIQMLYTSFQLVSHTHTQMQHVSRTPG